MMLNPMTPKKISTDALIEELKRLASEHGHPVTSTIMNEYGKYSAPTYLQRFGSWENAIHEAGLESTGESKIPRDELIAELNRVAQKLDHNPRTSDMREKGEYSSTVYTDRFGSWEKALEAADMEKDYMKQIPKEDLIDELNRLNEQLSHTVRAVDMEKHGAYSITTYTSRWDSWNNALRDAGIDPPNRGATAKELVIDLRSVGNDLGRAPTAQEIDTLGEFSRGTYIHRWGSWNEALRAAGFDR